MILVIRNNINIVLSQEIKTVRGRSKVNKSPVNTGCIKVRLQQWLQCHIKKKNHALLNSCYVLSELSLMNVFVTSSPLNKQI